MALIGWRLTTAYDSATALGTAPSSDDRVFTYGGVEYEFREVTVDDAGSQYRVRARIFRTDGTNLSSANPPFNDNAEFYLGNQTSLWVPRARFSSSNDNNKYWWYNPSWANSDYTPSGGSLQRGLHLYFQNSNNMSHTDTRYVLLARHTNTQVGAIILPKET